jgi:hypothetical protein
MQVGCLVVIGLFLGAILGAAFGVGLGFAWTKIFGTTDREGYSGMLVFLTFMPLGTLVGGVGGAVLLGLVGAKDVQKNQENTQENKE